MNPNKSISIIIATCVLLLQLSCEEQVMPRREPNPDWFNQMSRRMRPMSQPKNIEPAIQRTPKITFDKVVHNFGNVSPATTHICEFNFTNTGDGVLEIIEVEKTCGCTPFVLSKKEYTPREKGSLKVGFYSDTQLGSTTKPLYVFSNDESNPEVELAIKANIMAKVDYEPKALNLMLMQPNANCPTIKIRSLDNQPFSITSFKSTSDCITVDYNPAVKARQFVLQPKVNMKKLDLIMDGRFEIGLSHPETKLVSGTFGAPARFSTSPRTITIHRATSKQPTIKKVRVISNYNEDFEIESAFSQAGTIKVLNKERIRNGYELELQIIPPTPKNETRIFSDVFSMNLKGAGKLEIACNGFYPGATTTSSSSKTGKKCKTCKPHILDVKTFKELY
jgi:hypothetical protein